MRFGNIFLKKELFELFSSLPTGWWRSYHGIPPDISIKEHQWCLGLHQWHVQASIAQLWLSWQPRGTCAFFFFPPLLLLVLFTLTEHSKYHTQTCSTAEREQARPVTCPSAEFTLSLDEFLVHDVWKLDLAAFDKRNLCCTSMPRKEFIMQKVVVYVLTRCSITQRNERTAACTAQILICSDVSMLHYTIKPWDFLNSLNCFNELDMGYMIPLALDISYLPGGEMLTNLNFKLKSTW